MGTGDLARVAVDGELVALRPLAKVAVKEGSDPEVSWYQLSWKERRRVLKLAGQGRQHPDRRIAAVAERWARHRMRPWRERRGSYRFAVVALLGDAAPGSVLRQLGAERRAARKILRAVDAHRDPLGP